MRGKIATEISKFRVFVILDQWNGTKTPTQLNIIQLFGLVEMCFVFLFL
jgi:hypothetical protein